MHFSILDFSLQLHRVDIGFFNNRLHSWQVPITVHFDHGSSKFELVEALELVCIVHKHLLVYLPVPFGIFIHIAILMRLLMNVSL